MPTHINPAYSRSIESLDSIDLCDDATGNDIPFRAPSQPGEPTGARAVSAHGLNAATGLAFDPSQFLTLDDRFGLHPPSDDLAAGGLETRPKHALANATRMPLRAGDADFTGPSVLQMQAPSMRSPQGVASFAAALIQEGITDLFVCTRPGKPKPPRPGSPPSAPIDAQAVPNPLLAGKPTPRPGRFARLINRLMGRPAAVVRPSPDASTLRPAPAAIQGQLLMHRPVERLGLDLKKRSTELLYGGGAAELQGRDGKRRWFQLAATPPLHERLQRPFGPKAFLPPVTARAPGRLEVTYRDGDGRVHQRQIRLWNLEINRPDEWLPLLLRKSQARAAWPDEPIRCAIACNDGARNSGRAVAGMQLLQMLRDRQDQQARQPQAASRSPGGAAPAPVRPWMLKALPGLLADARARRSPLSACTAPGLAAEKMRSLTPLQAHEPLDALVDDACRAWLGHTDNQQPLARQLRLEPKLVPDKTPARASDDVTPTEGVAIASRSSSRSRTAAESASLPGPSSASLRRTSTGSSVSSTDSGLASSLPRTPPAVQAVPRAWTGNATEARHLRAFTHGVVGAYAGEPGERVINRSHLLRQGVDNLLDTLMGARGVSYTKTQSPFGQQLLQALRMHFNHQWEHLDKPGRRRWFAAVTAEDSQFARDLLKATTRLQTKLNGMRGIDNLGVDLDIQDLERDDAERYQTQEAILTIFREVAEVRAEADKRDDRLTRL